MRGIDRERGAAFCNEILKIEHGCIPCSNAKQFSQDPTARTAAVLNGRLGS